MPKVNYAVENKLGRAGLSFENMNRLSHAVVEAIKIILAEIDIDTDVKIILKPSTREKRECHVDCE